MKLLLKKISELGSLHHHTCGDGIHEKTKVNLSRWEAVAKAAVQQSLN